MEVWRLLFAVGNVLYTEARGAAFRVTEVNDDGIQVQVEKGGRVVRLTYERLDPILRDYEDLRQAIPNGHGVLDNINACLMRAGVPVDPQNESQYWAIVCEYRRRYDAVHTLVGGVP